MREYSLERKTSETDISLSLNIDGTGKYNINTGCGFLNHMLELFTRHGGFDLDVSCKGDVDVDYHHTAEDVAIVLGTALKNAIGDAKGINRYGSMLLPMDEALVLCAVDVSGRSHLAYNLTIPTQKIGDFDTELVEEFFMAFCRQAGITMHLRYIDGSNSHHIVEAAFKAVARALNIALSINEKFKDQIPSTKGTL